MAGVQPKDLFLKEASNFSSLREHRLRVGAALDTLDKRRHNSLADFSNLELARQRAAYTKCIS